MAQDGYPLSVTLKAGTGYDSPWIVVYGTTPDEVQAKLEGVHGGLIQATIEAANALKAANNAAPLLAGGQPAPQATPNPPQNGGWSQPAQQQAPPQQHGGGGGYGNAKTHPEGKTCATCNELLQWGMTRTNKGQWKCPQYRWNNGNPNEHTLEWA